ETPSGSSCDIGGPTSRDRLANVAAMLRAESVPVREIEVEWVAWKDAAALRIRVAAARGRGEAAYTTLVALLQGDGMLSPDDGGNLRPKIRIELHDLRQDRSGPLPAMP